MIDLQFNMSTMYASWDRTIALIASGAVPAEKVISHKAPLADWERVFDDIENLKALKGILIPEGT